MGNTIQSINDLSSILTRIQSEENANNRLAFLLAAQSNVIRSIGSLELATYTIDSIIDLLRDNHYNAASEEDKSFFQMQAANAIQSIFVFGKARLSILKQESAKAFDQLVEQGFSLIQNGLRKIVQLATTAAIEYATGGAATITIGANFKQSLKNSLKKGSHFLEPQKTRNFFATLKQRRQARKNAENAEDELLELEQSFLRKAIEYREYLGDSIVVKELMNEFYSGPDSLEKQKAVHFFKWLLLVGMFAIFALCMKTTFPDCTPFLVVFSVLIVLCLVFQIVCPAVAFSKAARKERETFIAFRELSNNSIGSEEYIDKLDAYETSCARYYGIINACDIMGSFFIAVGVMALFAGTSIFLWLIQANAFLSVLAKIGSVLCAIVGFVIDIPFLIHSFRKIKRAF